MAKEDKKMVVVKDIPYIDKKTKKLITKKEEPFEISISRFNEINKEYEYLIEFEKKQKGE